MEIAARQPGSPKAILVRWEKYRLIYNVLVALPLLALSNQTMIHAWAYWRMVISVFVFANLLLLLGHVTEIVVLWMKGPHRAVGTVVLVLVTLFAVLQSLGSICIY